MTCIAIQGVTGSYSETAVREMFGSAASILECCDFDAVFAAVETGRAQKAVIPVENKIVGPISPAVALLESKKYRVLERLSLQVRHVLSGAPGARFEDLKSVRSHIEALRQCRKFLAKHPTIVEIVGADTASSVRQIVAEGNRTQGAIGSPRAAELYGADVLREDIADDIDNWTVFYLIGN